jgi:hypothetical protein
VHLSPAWAIPKASGGISRGTRTVEREVVQPVRKKNKTIIDLYAKVIWDPLFLLYFVRRLDNFSLLDKINGFLSIPGLILVK